MQLVTEDHHERVPTHASFQKTTAVTIIMTISTMSPPIAPPTMAPTGALLSSLPDCPGREEWCEEVSLPLSLILVYMYTQIYRVELCLAWADHWWVSLVALYHWWDSLVALYRWWVSLVALYHWWVVALYQQKRLEWHTRTQTHICTHTHTHTHAHTHARTQRTHARTHTHTQWRLRLTSSS